MIACIVNSTQHDNSEFLQAKGAHASNPRSNAKSVHGNLVRKIENSKTILI